MKLTLPQGVGSDGAFSYDKSYDACSDRLISLSTTTSPSIGAKWAWLGKDRLLGITTNGPLRTATRYGYVGGPGAQPPLPPPPTPAPLFQLGTLTFGTAGASDPVADVGRALGETGGSSAWGQLAFGYRTGDNAKLGRQTMTGSVSAPNILENQGWSWSIDNGKRLTGAGAGRGSLTGSAITGGIERFRYSYGRADQILSAAREVADQTTTYDVGANGRPNTRTTSGAPQETITYDSAGRRTSDARFVYAWYWYGKLSRVTVKSGWGSAYEGQQIAYTYDSLGRLLSRTHAGQLPQGSTNDDDRPFIERREYLWDGSGLIAETAYAQDGSVRWRKSFVPGAKNLDDQVQLRVEDYGSSTTVQSDRLFSYLRDEEGTVLGLVEETAAANPANPPLAVKYLYSPYGEAHVELGPELLRARFDSTTTSIGQGSTLQTQSFDPALAVPGAFRATLSAVPDLASAGGGITVERRASDGSWVALAPSERPAIRDDSEPDELIVLPVAGWQRGTTYRVTVTTSLADTNGRHVAASRSVEFTTPAVVAQGQAGVDTGVAFDEVFPVDYDSAKAFRETAGGRFLGGQPLGWQGHLVDPVLGLELVRNRVWDSRTGAWLSEDPAGDVESPNLYGFVAGRPHEATDPLGLAGGPAPQFIEPLVEPMVPPEAEPVVPGQQGSPWARHDTSPRDMAPVMAPESWGALKRQIQTAPRTRGPRSLGGRTADQMSEREKQEFLESRVAMRNDPDFAARARGLREAEATRGLKDLPSVPKAAAGGSGGEEPPGIWDSKAGRYRDPQTGQFITDPAKPPSPYKFTDAQRRAAWRALANDPNAPLTQEQREEIEARGWRGPQRVNPKTGQVETMELSHEPVPLRDGGTWVKPRWPDDHAAVDPYRRLKED